MRRGVMVLLLVAGAAWADVPPEEPPRLPDTSCVGKAPGAACTGGGRCVTQVVRRPNFSKGTPPTWEVTEVLVCQGAPRAERTWALGLGLVVALGALAVGLRERGRSAPARAVGAHRPRSNEEGGGEGTTSAVCFTAVGRDGS